jgi:hypothetical protein
MLASDNDTTQQEEAFGCGNQDRQAMAKLGERASTFE